ncbi:hypothetical protein [Azospirillum doebereinerae]|uniref:Uncharacterized protein n=1 Tax=Azospirillum doebereinerae TaxID=92933 RepID=A0A3S0XJ12_9PROT|nr:hypothetical protein [Azospirillum doebereinerae]RUQ63997.1 hypothetical protein EJ913_27115 [Azospirillum doebereinerae]
MTIDLEGLLASLNTQRIAVDGAFGALLLSVWVWMGEVQGEAQRVTVYLSLAIVLGRAVLFLRDVRARSRGRSKPFPGERFDGDRSTRP